MDEIIERFKEKMNEEIEEWIAENNPYSWVLEYDHRNELGWYHVWNDGARQMAQHLQNNVDEQPKTNEDCLTLFQKLPRLNHRYEVKEDGDYIPTLYSLNGNWFISWLNFDDDEVLDVYWANTIEEVVKIAYDGYQAKVIEEVNGEPPTKEQLEKV